MGTERTPTSDEQFRLPWLDTSPATSAVARLQVQKKRSLPLQGPAKKRASYT